jgi:hypothetical protein
MGKKMHLWPVLFAALLVALLAGFAVFHLAGALIQSLNHHPKLD